MLDGWGQIGRSRGVASLFEGWAPTAIGYSLQGACKFGFYELFKKQFSDAVGEEIAFKYRTGLYLAASASAEVIADVALCPWEAIKVRMQTSATPYASGVRSAAMKLVANEGVSGLYKGLFPLWMRQVPYTMMKFACFETTVEAIYRYVLSAKPKSEYNKMQQLGVTFAAGYWAGIFCAVVSHPADTVVSKLNQSNSGGIGNVLKDLGLRGVWRGLGPRIIMVGTLTALQWFIYDTFKVYVGLPTSGAAPAAAPACLKKE